MNERRRYLVHAGQWALAAGATAWLPPARAALEFTTVSLGVPGPGNVLYMPATLAARLGMDRAEGLVFDIRYMGGGPQAFRDMVGRNVDFALGGLSALALQRLNGRPVKSVLAINSVPAYTLLVRSDLRREVKRVADLSGRVLGVKGHVPGGRSTTQLVTEYVLARSGLKPSSVNFVSVGQAYDSQHAALLSKTVDALMGDEPFASRMVREKAAFVLADFHDMQTVRDTFGGLFLNSQMCTREDVIAQQPQLVARVVAAMRNTLGWLRDHSAAEVVAALGLAGDEERRAMREVMRAYKQMYSRDGRFSAEQLSTVERFLHATEPLAWERGFRIDTLVDARWAGTAA